MIVFKFFPIVQLMLISYTDLTTAYRGSKLSQKPAYDPYDFYYLRNLRTPYGSYYPSTYSQVYPDEYYYTQDVPPAYYVSPRASKYDFYQSALPYYYQDLPTSQSNYNYLNYGDSSTQEDTERLLQDIEREQRERAQPIGHEIRYENDYNSDDDGVNDDTNAFLNNLMLQQLYKYPASYYDQYPYADDLPEVESTSLPKWDSVPYDRPVKFEDEDVKELQELPKKQKSRKNKQRKQKTQKVVSNVENNYPAKRSEDNVVYTDRKPVVKEPTSTDSGLSEGPRRDTRGQKEEVLMRPATPVRHPFSQSVMDMFNQQEEKKRSPSAYEKIKHLLDMDKNVKNQPENSMEVRPIMKKRIVSSEDSLTRQLSILKKSQ